MEYIVTVPSEEDMIVTFYYPGWLGRVVGMIPNWNDDVGVANNLRTCADWTRSSPDGHLWTRMTQLYTLLQDVRRNYHADKLEATKRFKRVGKFRDTVKGLLESAAGETMVMYEQDVQREWLLLGNMTRTMILNELRKRRGMSWYKRHHNQIDWFIAAVGNLS
jgi:hypothetical protein